MVMMEGAEWPTARTSATRSVACRNGVFSYALYASGKDAVLGGMIVVAIAYIIYGFLAPRFTAAQPAAVATARAA